MEYLQNLLDNSSVPVVTAFLLGLLTAISPCPLATNIAAIGYLSKDIANKRQVFCNGLLYTLGRIVAYSLLGIILIVVLRQGTSLFTIEKALGKWSELLFAPLLVLVGLFMLFGSRINLPKFGFSGNGERITRYGGWGALLWGMLFALALCPTSGIFYFGMRRAGGTARRMGCVSARGSFFAGVLPDERGFLFRDADSDVGG